MFPDPGTVNVTREPRHRYLTGDSVTRSLGVELTTKIVTQVLRAVFECNGVGRAPGRVGHLRRFKVAVENTLMYEYLDGNNLPTAWPSNMLLQVSTFRLYYCYRLLILSRWDHSMKFLLESTALRRLPSHLFPAHI